MNYLQNENQTQGEGGQGWNAAAKHNFIFIYSQMYQTHRMLSQRQV